MAHNETPVRGRLTHNAAAPTGVLVGAMMAIATAAVPSYTEGNLVLSSVDLSGRQRITGVGGGGQQVMASSVPVVIASNQSTIPVAGALTNNSGAPAATNVGALSAVANAAAPTYTEGNQVLISVDLAGNQRVVANITQIAGTAVATSNGVVSAGVQRVAVASDNTPFGVKVSKDASANAVANPIWIEMTDGAAALGTVSNPLVTTIGSGGTLVDTKALVTAANITTNGGLSATTDLATADITTAKTGKVIEVTFGAPVRGMYEIGTWDNTTFTSYRTLFHDPAGGAGNVYIPKDVNEITFAGGTNKKFRIRATNLDAVNADKMYASITYIEV